MSTVYTQFKAQFAIRPADAAGSVHVQVTAPKGLFHNGFCRSYGCAFEVKNAALFNAVKGQTPTLKSKAGTDRMYVGGTIEFHEGDGATIIVNTKVVQPTLKVIARLPESQPVSINVTDSQILE